MPSVEIAKTVTVFNSFFRTFYKCTNKADTGRAVHCCCCCWGKLHLKRMKNLKEQKKHKNFIKETVSKEI